MTRGKRHEFTPAPTEGRWIVRGTVWGHKSAHYYRDDALLSACGNADRLKLTDDDPDVIVRCGLCRQRVYGWRAASGANG